MNLDNYVVKARGNIRVYKLQFTKESNISQSCIPQEIID